MPTPSRGGDRPEGVDVISMDKRSREFERGDQVLVAHASHSGTAEGIAREICIQNPVRCDLYSLGELSPQSLETYGQQLFIVATHGDGGPPDNAAKFFDLLQASRPNLFEVQFAMLALGSRAYPRFCQFGRDFYRLLIRAQAQPQVLPVEVHNNCAATVTHWRNKVNEVFSLCPDPDADWEPATVMAVERAQSSSLHVTFYIKGLEFVGIERMWIMEPSKRSHPVECAVLSGPASPFTCIEISDAGRTSRSLADAKPGDKYLVRWDSVS